jgi:putative FmdB family regulatory protein
VPLFRYRCPACEVDVSKLHAAKARPEYCCEKCGGPLVRNPRGPSTQTVERLDNGAMGKAVERLANAEALYHDRSKAHTKETRKNLGLDE